MAARCSHPLQVFHITATFNLRDVVGFALMATSTNTLHKVQLSFETIYPALLCPSLAPYECEDVSSLWSSHGMEHKNKPNFIRRSANLEYNTYTVWFPEFSMTAANHTNGRNGINGSNGTTIDSLTNYVAFQINGSERTSIGHYDLDSDRIQPLAFASGTLLQNLYQVIEIGESGIIPSGESISASSVRILPPISGRDVLCVGKNYAEHAKEFNGSGFDSSDKVDQPTHPVIFTKRFTSIIANGEDIYPHPGFTETIDYEGEIGVIVGKAGHQISEESAMQHVWGYTIINDMTARERQRDHKQFYIGKSPDTFCPMGPIAVPAGKLDKTLRVQTRVNGEVRQDATTEDLIFSIPFLIKTMSEGQTLMPGDVLATGTPAGVGIGKKPPTYLKSGDEVTVSVAGLGSLTNRIGGQDSSNPTVSTVHAMSHIPSSNKKAVDSNGLTKIDNKMLHYRQQGSSSGENLVFVHGLGGTMDYWTPLIQASRLDQSHNLHLLDLEGHGLSPTSPLSSLSIESFAADLKGVFDHAGISSGTTLFAHSMGCLIAVRFALDNPGLISKLVLVGPPPSPLPAAASSGTHARAYTVRTKGMTAVVDAIVTAGTSEKTKSSNPLAVTAIRLSLLGQDAEGYAKACTALANATNKLDFAAVKASTLIITGSEDKVSPQQLCEGYVQSLPKGSSLEVLSDVGHWHVYEDVEGVSRAVSKFL
ncbi:hypothetical protein E4T38_03525 [Aureobasidium subglaciale]|nr:hypothetical protein E4T38_03525 [Aureobasidium subglaciale]KAI5225633.1 hypothetical protein E4T40_03300 [Aureobasidium subglaciale]KAI5263971.1 hypothetical protein E4T46_03299 [Aureobasidium subglaciale]